MRCRPHVSQTVCDSLGAGRAECSADGAGGKPSTSGLSGAPGHPRTPCQSWGRLGATGTPSLPKASAVLGSPAICGSKSLSSLSCSWSECWLVIRALAGWLQVPPTLGREPCLCKEPGAGGPRTRYCHPSRLSLYFRVELRQQFVADHLFLQKMERWGVSCSPLPT